MLLHPSDNWKWYYNSSDRVLMLDMGEHYQFKSDLLSKNLTFDVCEGGTFSIDDADNYRLFLKAVTCFIKQDERFLAVVFNAVAAKRFHKPVMPQSWFFSKATDALSPNSGDIVVLANELNQGKFLIIENCGEASLCMCMEDDFMLSENKKLGFSGSIKVMNDRMGTYCNDISTNLSSSLALVG